MAHLEQSSPATTGNRSSHSLIFNWHNQPAATFTARANACSAAAATLLQVPSRVNAFAATARAITGARTTATFDGAFLHFFLFGHNRLLKLFPTDATSWSIMSILSENARRVQVDIQVELRPARCSDDNSSPLRILNAIFNSCSNEISYNDLPLAII